VDLSYLSVELNCPKCDFALDILVKQIMAEEIILCPGCLTEIQLVGESGSSYRAQSDIDEALNDLQQYLEKFGRQS
jgi:hypothetical protein